MNEPWYRNSVIYELNIRAFMDEDGNGRGDFRGLITRLDYLESLGIDCIWLLPMYPSPGRDDGYDVADYYSINPEYGTLDDFREFIEIVWLCNARYDPLVWIGHLQFRTARGRSTSAF